MRENIDLNRFREFGDIISDTFVLIRQNFKPLFKSYFVICGLFLVSDIVISTVVNADKGNPAALTPMGFLELFFDFVNYTVLLITTLSYLALYKEKSSQPPTVVEVWGYFRYYFFRGFLTQILMAIACTIGFFLCLVPSIYLAVVFTLVTPIMVMENGNIEYAFKKAFKMISGNWWFTLGIMLLVTIIILMVMLVLMLPPIIIYGGGQWLTGKSLGGTAGILQAVAINLCQVLWIIPTLSSALIYFSIIEEKEGNSLINRIKMFGRNNPGADQIPTEQY